MDNFAFLRTMDIEELIALMNVTTDEVLKENISHVLGKNGSWYSRNDYSSDRSTYITPSLDSNYRTLISDVKIEDIEFFQNLVCKGVGNNIGYHSGLNKIETAHLVYGDAHIQSFLKEYGVDRLWKFINVLEYGCVKDRSIKDRKIACKIKESSIIKDALEEAKYLRYFETFFENAENRELYEGTFNSYMYMKDYLYRLLTNNDDISMPEVFSEQRKKFILAKDSIQDISKFLLDIRTRISDSRLSAFNNKLRFCAKSKPSVLTDYQRQYIELVSFGTSLEQLENKDFSDTERLIYIPKKKI